MTATNVPAGSPSDHPAANHDVQAIKAGIERTQAHLAETVAELQRKLTVSHLVEQTKRSAEERLEHWAHTGLAVAAIAATNVIDMVDDVRARMRRNPTPLVLAGAGMAAVLWQTARRRRRRGSR
jgi:hypothetical protein